MAAAVARGIGIAADEFALEGWRHAVAAGISRYQDTREAAEAQNRQMSADEGVSAMAQGLYEGHDSFLAKNRMTRPPWWSRIGDASKEDWRQAARDALEAARLTRHRAAA